MPVLWHHLPVSLCSCLVLFAVHNQAEEEVRWFNPTPARRTKALLRRHRPERLEETVEERVDRMAGAGDQRKQ